MNKRRGRPAGKFNLERTMLLVDARLALETEFQKYPRKHKSTKELWNKVLALMRSKYECMENVTVLQLQRKFGSLKCLYKKAKTDNAQLKPIQKLHPEIYRKFQQVYCNLPAPNTEQYGNQVYGKRNAILETLETDDDDNFENEDYNNGSSLSSTSLEVAECDSEKKSTFNGCNYQWASEDCYEAAEFNEMGAITVDSDDCYQAESDCGSATISAVEYYQMNDYAYDEENNNISLRALTNDLALPAVESPRECVHKGNSDVSESVIKPDDAMDYYEQLASAYAYESNCSSPTMAAIELKPLIIDDNQEVNGDSFDRTTDNNEFTMEVASTADLIQNTYTDATESEIVIIDDSSDTDSVYRAESNSSNSTMSAISTDLSFTAVESTADLIDNRVNSNNIESDIITIDDESDYEEDDEEAESGFRITNVISLR